MLSSEGLFLLSVCSSFVEKCEFAFVENDGVMENKGHESQMQFFEGRKVRTLWEAYNCTCC